MINIAIFASGSGTNAENMIRYFSKSETFKVVLVISNNAGAGVHLRAQSLDIPSFSFTREAFLTGQEILNKLRAFRIDFIVLAGFLHKIPKKILLAYPHRIINIHPALLPKYGGKGMYGNHVHEAVIAAGESETGITIHYINEQYDEGAILFQTTCPVYSTDTPDVLAGRVHALEYLYYPRVIEEIIKS